MAEERLIDDDKDRKYKIRINENGEEELVIETPDEDDDEPVFDIPAYDEDDEEAAVLTPEQLAERERIRAEEVAARAVKVEGLLQKANDKIKEGDFEAALYAVSQAEELDSKNGSVYCLKLKVLTRNFTEFNSLDTCKEAADGVSEYASAEQKAELKDLAVGLKEKIDEQAAHVEKLSEENERGKDERRSTFAAKKKSALAVFTGTALPLFLFAVLTIVFSTIIFSSESGVFVVVTIVFGALTFIALIATLVTGHKLWVASRHVKLNEKDSATKIGREYTKSNGDLQSLKNIYSCFSDDIS